jgi:aminomethyltransferase
MKNVYTDTSSEYQAVRCASGLVDYQGIGLVRVAGNDASAFLGGVLTRSVDFLLEGQISSALVLTEQGTLLAEVAVHCQGGDYLVEIWPAQARTTIEHLLSTAASRPNLTAASRPEPTAASRPELTAASRPELTVTDVSADYRVFGLEGPETPRLAQKLLPFPVSSMAYRSFVNADHDGQELLISRTGVSGEYGYKVHVPVAAAEDVRAELISLGATEVGLDALNTCRMEMRFANLEAESGGQPRTPFDFGLQWMVDFNHDFTARDALQATWDAGLDTAPVCWVADEGVCEVPAHGAAITVGNTGIGTVSHSVFSPKLGRVIGTALVAGEVAASGLEYSIDGSTVRTISAPFMVATSFGVPLE